MVKTQNKTALLSGVSTKLIAMIIIVILALEVIIFLPSLASARANWLDDRLNVAAVALQVIEAVPDDMAIPASLADQLLHTAGAQAIAMRSASSSELIERSDAPMPTLAKTVDMRKRDPMTLMLGGVDTLFYGADRTLRIVGSSGPTDLDIIEVIMPENGLRAEMIVYARNIFLLSLTIAILTAAVLFLFINRSLIRPIRRLIRSMISFRQQPENGTLIIKPSQRRDEIGIAENELAAMQSDLFIMLRQRRHLADLGLAVAKINHDLRNTLSSAQLLSDQVATLDDPNVQRLAPRLVHTLDKAIGFTQSVLSYGRESAVLPKPQPVDVRALFEEVTFDAGLRGHPSIMTSNETPDGLILEVDPDQLARIFVNLAKNAREALEQVSEPQHILTVIFSAKLSDTELIIAIQDNGPGLPPRARENLFVAFEGSARAGGTGLGLAIARELSESNGGRLAFVEQEEGTRFEITFPRSFVLE